MLVVPALILQSRVRRRSRTCGGSHRRAPRARKACCPAALSTKVRGRRLPENVATCSGFAARTTSFGTAPEKNVSMLLQLSSTLTASTCASLGSRAAASDRTSGSSSTQGAHHVAQKWRMRGRPRSSESCTLVPSGASTSRGGAGENWTRSTCNCEGAGSATERSCNQ